MTQIGSTLPVHSSKTCILYDASSGKLRHRHSVVTFVGGREPSEAQIEADAFAALRALPGLPPGELHVLHVAHDAMHPGKRYRVDLASKQLVLQE